MTSIGPLLAILCLAAAPAHGKRPVRVQAKLPSALVVGQPVTISGRVTGSITGRLTARLQRRARGRWTWMSAAPARVHRRRFTLRWTPEQAAGSARIRVVVMRGRKRIAASASRALRLVQQSIVEREAICVRASRTLSVGGDQDWSHALDLIAYSKPGSNGASQLHVIRPDGSGDTDISTGAVADGLRADRHKTLPVWDPTGRWIVVQVESSDWYPGVNQRDAWQRERAINGVASSLWAASPNGERWVRLTREAWPASYGVMAAHFSRDGRQLVFSRLVEPAGLLPWGKYRLILADFRVEADGTPRLANERDITPPGHVFAEAHAFSPSGTEVLFASYYGAIDPFNMDIWSLSLVTGETTRLTTSKRWDEHATFSPSGRRIVYFTTELGVGPFSGELMSMDADGTDKRRLTAFNQPGRPGSAGEKTMVLRPTFNADGSRIAVTEQLAREYPTHRRMSVLNLSHHECG